MLFEALAGLHLALQPALLMHVLSNLICNACTEELGHAVMLLHISFCFLMWRNWTCIRPLAANKD